mmetsp:Transcript_50214/g.87637  ORF Transcript_50214/g.87637 Transcript_50214/m.87637 type:complete len:295 (-) Transcript_50214:512-1396(-)
MVAQVILHLLLEHEVALGRLHAGHLLGGGVVLPLDQLGVTASGEEVQVLTCHRRRSVLLGCLGGFLLLRGLQALQCPDSVGVHVQGALALACADGPHANETVRAGTHKLRALVDELHRQHRGGVSLKGAQQAVIHDTPHLHRAITGATHQGLVDRTEGDLPDAALVAVERRDRGEVRGAPETHALVLTRGSNQGIVGRHGHSVNVLVVRAHAVRGYQLAQLAFLVVDRGKSVHRQRPALENLVCTTGGTKSNATGIRSTASGHAHRAHSVGVAFTYCYSSEGGHVPEQYTVILR